MKVVDVGFMPMYFFGRHASRWGCYWNRDIGAAVDASGLDVVSLQRLHFGYGVYPFLNYLVLLVSIAITTHPICAVRQNYLHLQSKTRPNYSINSRNSVTACERNDVGSPIYIKAAECCVCSVQRVWGEAYHQVNVFARRL
jgi:hypothetical protein